MLFRNNIECKIVRTSFRTCYITIYTNIFMMATVMRILVYTINQSMFCSITLKIIHPNRTISIVYEWGSQHKIRTEKRMCVKLVFMFFYFLVSIFLSQIHYIYNNVNSKNPSRLKYQSKCTDKSKMNFSKKGPN